MKRYFDTVILGLGIFFLGFGFFLISERTLPKKHVLAASVITQSESVPVTIKIEDLGIELPIFRAFIRDRRWDLTKEGVSYLATSPLPGQVGNSVMYGHNWRNLLGNLKQAKPGQKIKIVMSTGEVFSYTVYFVSEVTPDESHIYSNTLDSRLTVYTCSGFLDQKRLVVTSILD